MKSPIQTQRILCLWFPDWPLQRLLAVQPDLDQRVLLLTEQQKRGEFVRYANQRALRRGIRAGMPVSEARTYVRSRDGLAIQTVQPKDDLAALQELALRCETYSFCVCLEEAAQPECLLLNVTGIAHFWNGEQSLVEQIEQGISVQYIEVRSAIADSIGAAWAGAHFLAADQRPIVIPSDQLTALKALPVEGLRLDEATLTKLHRLGLRSIQQILDLERATLLRRLGPTILLRLDQFTGLRSELLVPCRPTPRFQVAHHLDDGSTHPEAIEQLSFLLLRRLLKLFQTQRLGTRQLVFRFLMEQGNFQEITLRLCENTADLRHLSDLLRFQLERLRLNAPLIGLQIEALDVAPLNTVQQKLFDSAPQNHARHFSMLLNRLASRLGENAVTVPHLLPDPVPERAVRLWPVADTTQPPSITSVANFRVGDLATVLFCKPRPIEVIAAAPDGPPAVLFWKETRFDIACHWGPERIESGWWQSASVARDYYRVETVIGQWLYVFRCLQDQRWFWQGEL